MLPALVYGESLIKRARQGDVGGWLLSALSRSYPFFDSLRFSIIPMSMGR